MSPSKNNITILDVGHGNSTIIIDETSVVIIDAGTKSTLLEFLSENQIYFLNTILLSHADLDHIGGLLAILSSGIFHVDKIRLNTDSIKGTVAWDDLVYELDKMGKENKLDFKPCLTSSDTNQYDTKNYKIQVLGPSNYLAAKGAGSRDRKGRQITTNSISAVIRILNNKDNPFLLLPGDIDEVGLDDLTEHECDLTSPILIFPHHGGLPGSNEKVEQFTLKISDLVKPDTVIFSIERNNRYNTPRPDIISALFKYSNKIRIMCTELSFSCANQLPSVFPTHLCGVCAQGSDGKKCCAGTIIINQSSPELIMPLSDSHQDYIIHAAPTALCNLLRAKSN